MTGALQSSGPADLWRNSANQHQVYPFVIGIHWKNDDSDYSSRGPLPLEKSRGTVGRQDRTLMTQESSLDPAAEPESPSAGILSEADFFGTLFAFIKPMIRYDTIIYLGTRASCTSAAHRLLNCLRHLLLLFVCCTCPAHGPGSTIRHPALLWHMAR